MFQNIDMWSTECPLRAVTFSWVGDCVPQWPE